MIVPTEYFGGNSDGAMEMEEWLRGYCPGCRFSSRRGEREEEMGGMGCDLPVQAYLEPHKPIEEWSADAGPDPSDPVCFKREDRPPSPLRGVRQGQRQAAGQEVLL